MILGVDSSHRNASSFVRPDSAFGRALRAEQSNPAPDVTIPQQKDKQAWQEIQRERDEGSTDSQIWFGAVKGGDRELTTAFVDTPPDGFNVSQTNASGGTALHTAVGAKNGLDLAKILVEKGNIDLTVLDKAGHSAYQVAKAASDKPGSDPSLKAITDYLKQKLNDQANAAKASGDTARLDVLVKAGADDPRAVAPPAPPPPGPPTLTTPPPPPPGGLHTDPTPEAAPPGPDTVRPPGDTRDSAAIIADSPLLRNLRPSDKDGLKKQVGDFEHDPDAAYRANAVLNAIENYRSDGEPVFGDTVGNGKIDGFAKPPVGRGNFSGDVAQAGTEADRLETFINKGYSTLKRNDRPIPSLPPGKDTKRPDGDTRSADQIIKANPLLANLGKAEQKQLAGVVGDYTHDADAAYRASTALDFIERYERSGDPLDPAGIGNGKIDGYTGKTQTSNGGQQTHGTEKGSEAQRFQDFITKGYQALDGANVPRDSRAEAPNFADDLQQEADDRTIREANLPANRQDILDHPDNYSVEQRYAARLELTDASEKMQKQIQLYTDAGVHNYGDPAAGTSQTDQNFSTPGKFMLNTDPQKVLGQLNDSINKLTDDDVNKYQSDNQNKDLQAILKSDPDRAAKAQALYDDTKNGAVGLGDYLAKAGGNVLQGMRSYLSSASTLNGALGHDGKPLDDDLTIGIDKSSPEGQIVMDAYKTQLQDPKTLQSLIDDKGYSEKDATAEIESRAALFTSFGANPDDVTASVQENVQNHMMQGAKPDDFNGSGFIGSNGEIDENFINATLDKLRQDDPSAAVFQDEKGEPLSNAQIITAVRGSWDAFRNAAKTNSALGKLAPDNAKQFMDNNNQLQKTFGSGAMHAVSSLLAAGLSIARSQTGQSLSPEAKVAVAGNAIQAFGLATQGFEISQRTDPKIINKLWGMKDNGKQPAAQSEADDARRKTIATNIMDFGKTLNSSGGLMAGAVTIAFGIKALKQGDKAEAGIYLAQGISNAGTGLGPLTEALAPRIASIAGAKWSAVDTASLFTKIGIASGVLNVAATLAAIGYGVYDAVHTGQLQKPYFDSFVPALKQYGIDGGANPPPPPPSQSPWAQYK